MLAVELNNRIYNVSSNSSILSGCKMAGIEVSQYCYHESLSVSGNCRMCLVELEETNRNTDKFKPIAACTAEFDEDDIVVLTDSFRALKARENVAATLLINHPLDCPICDQGGDCDLQDQSKVFGQDISRFWLNRRAVSDKDTGYLIKTSMNRCIQCTRCVRFGEEIAGVKYFGTVERGTLMEISTYVNKKFFSEISGNVIDLCPVGALTSNAFEFKARPWELSICDSIDINDSVGSHIKLATKGAGIVRISAKYNRNINQGFISDIARFSSDTFGYKNVKRGLLLLKNANKTISTNILLSDLILKLRLLIKNYNYQNFVFLVNEDLGFEEFRMLINNCYKNNAFNLRTISKNYFFYNNFYYFNIKDKIADIEKGQDFGLIIGLNPRIECSSLNIRLKKQYAQSTTVWFGAGFSFLNTYETEFLNLNLKRILTIFEGKVKFLSFFFLFSDNPLLFISDNISKRGLDSTFLILFLKKILKNIKIFNISKTANNEMLYFLNIKSFSNFDIKLLNLKKKLLLSINLTDSYLVRKILLDLNNHFIWFNNQYFQFLTLLIKKHAAFIVPTFGDYEKNKIFLNLENRFQLVKQIFSTSNASISYQSWLQAIFIKYNFDSNIKTNTPMFSFIDETIKYPILFDNHKKIYSYLVEKFDSNYINMIYKLPLKPSFEEYNLYSKASRSSRLLMEVKNAYCKTINYNFY